MRAPADLDTWLDIRPHGRIFETERSVFWRARCPPTEDMAAEMARCGRGDGAEEMAAQSAATRQRIVELAAPVFNERIRRCVDGDLVDATGSREGRIYNHFGSKEQLALEAYDHAMSLVTEGLQRSQKPEHDAVQRLQSMVRSFATAARDPVIAGGCPIMNTAIEADDTPRRAARPGAASMTPGTASSDAS